MPLKIYYLDDEPALLEMFVDLFGRPDREIVTFKDPDAAIVAIQSSPPDILFIDFRLPGCTGDEVAQRLDPKIPMVLITGDLNIKCSTKFMSIFEKPYKSAQIEELIESLQKKRAG